MRLMQPGKGLSVSWRGVEIRSVKRSPRRPWQPVTTTLKHPVINVGMRRRLVHYGCHSIERTKPPEDANKDTAEPWMSMLSVYVHVRKYATHHPEAISGRGRRASYTPSGKASLAVVQTMTASDISEC